MWVFFGADLIPIFNDHFSSKAVVISAEHRIPHVSREASAAADLQHTTGLSIGSPPTSQEAVNKSSFSRRIPGITLPTAWK